MSEDEAIYIDAEDHAASHVAGDLLSALVDELRTLQKPWQATSEFEQRDVIDRLRRRVRSNVATACRLIAAADRPTLDAIVDQVVFKDGVKAVLTMSKANPSVHDLADAAGSEVLIVVSGAEGFMGGVDDVQPDPDQPVLFDEDNAA